MKIYKLSVFIFLLSFKVAHSQTASSFNTLFDNLKQYDRAYEQEKVHIHFDKPFYALGDTIWFEGYVVNAFNNIPGDKSKLMHVELINNKDSICNELQLPVTAGFAPGDITLSEKMQEGTYTIRAYTNWMRNFDEAYFFYKTIKVINPFPALQPKPIATKTINTQIPATELILKKYNVQFFPESGRLVEGLKSELAFKAVSASGDSINTTGKVIDEQNNDIVNFKTSHAGMGSFSFIPAKNRTYTAVMKLPDSTTVSIPLPKALKAGYIITSDNTNRDSLFITLFCSPELINKEEMVLMPLSNGNPLFFFKTKFPDSRINFTIPKNKLPGGILQLTLFNSLNEPVAERLVFNDYLENVRLTTDNIKQTYKKREKTEFTLHAINRKRLLLTGSFSMAVTNADEITNDEQKEKTIFSNLLLTSDLKGYIEDPNYYFIEPDSAKNKQLDDLLLTQGWRRFVWKDIISGAFPKTTFQHEQAVSIIGTVRDSKKSPITGVHVNLLSEQIGTGGIHDTITDKDGRFKFSLPLNLANDSFILQEKQKRDIIKLDAYLPPAIIDQTAFPDTVINKTMANYAKASAQALTISGKASVFIGTNMLKEVVIKDYTPRNKLKSFNSTSTNLNGVGNADKVFTAKDIENWTDLNALEGRLPGVIFQRGHPTKIILMGSIGHNTPDVLLLVDGQTGYSLDQIPAQDVESIEFMKSITYTSIYGTRGSGGVLLVTTKKGPDMESVDTTRKTNMLPFKLPVYMAREFYSPIYDKPESSNKRTDMRTTVYWKPNIITDKNGNAKVEYYNTNVPGNYRIIIEGITTNGNLCRQIFNYKIE